MGRSHLRCKNRTLLLCSVSLLRVGDKFAFLLNSRLILFYFIYFMLLLVLLYCPKLGQKFFTKWCYSPDYVFILSDLVPHWILIVSFVWTVVMVHGFLQMDSACGVYRPNGLVFYHRLWNRELFSRLLLRSVWCSLYSPICFQSALNGMSKSMSCSNIAAPGEAFNTLWYV